MSEQQALTRFVAHQDAEAFAHLVRSYEQMVYASALRQLGNAEEAAEATQQTFIRLARHAGTVRGDVGAWLHRTAVNAATDLIRRAATRRKHERAFAAERPTEAWPDDVDWPAVSAAIDAAIADLDEPEQTAIVEHFLRGRSQRELADDWQTSQSSVCRRIRDGVEHLRAMLAQRGVAAPAAGVLAMAMAADSAQAAAPATLASELTKVGLVGGAHVATATTGGAMVKAAIVAAALIGAATLGVVLVAGVSPAQQPAMNSPSAPTQLLGVWYAVDGSIDDQRMVPGNHERIEVDGGSIRSSTAAGPSVTQVDWQWTDRSGGTVHGQLDGADVTARWLLDDVGRLHLAMHRDPARIGEAPTTVDPQRGVDLTIYARTPEPRSAVSSLLDIRQFVDDRTLGVVGIDLAALPWDAALSRMPAEFVEPAMEMITGLQRAGVREAFVLLRTTAAGGVGPAVVVPTGPGVNVDAVAAAMTKFGEPWTSLRRDKAMLAYHVTLTVDDLVFADAVANTMRPELEAAAVAAGRQPLWLVAGSVNGELPPALQAYLGNYLPLQLVQALRWATASFPADDIFHGRVEIAFINNEAAEALARTVVQIDEQPEAEAPAPQRAQQKNGDGSRAEPMEHKNDEMVEDKRVTLQFGVTTGDDIRVEGNRVIASANLQFYGELVE